MRHGLEPRAQRFHIQLLLAGGEGDAKAGAEVGKAQRDMEAFLHPGDEGEHIFIVVSQYGGGEFLAFGMDVDARDLNAGEIGGPESLLVDAEFAGNAAVARQR